MANTYLTISAITFEMLLVLHNNVIAGKQVTRTWEKQFAKVGAKIGNTVMIRKPPRYTVVDGATFVPQDYADEFVSLTVDKHKQVGCEFANDDLTLSMDDFSRRFLAPALVPLSNQVDIDILANYAQVWNATGTPGTVVATDTPMLDAKTLLINASAPFSENEEPMLVTPKVNARLSSGLAGRYNPQKEVSGLYLKGSMGPALGWNFFSDQNMPVHTTGAPAGAPQVNAAGQTGASIVTKGWTGSITGLLKKGDVIQIAGVYSVNPVTYLSTGELQNFVLTADADSSGGAATLYISPSIVISGKGQTVTAAPAASADITVWGTGTVANVASKSSPQCMGWQREAITLACVDLALPDEGEGVKAVRVADDDLGLSMVFMRSFDPRQYSRVSRVDILYGVCYTRPEHIVRVAA